MFRKIFTYKSILFFFCFFICIINSATLSAQLYQHNFGTAGISSHPYTVQPQTLGTGLSGSAWTNSTGAWTSSNGSTGQAITLSGSGTITATLTFTVNPGFEAVINSYSFWSRRSNTGPGNYSLKINNTTVGTGSVTTGGADTGLTNISIPVTGLTGNVTVTLTLTGAGGGTFRLDDFTLYGLVTSSCNSAVISSFLPASAPANTIVAINGSGFTNAVAVAFNNTPATAFTVISNTQIQATVPAGATAGLIKITTTDGCEGQSAIPFTLLTSNCLSENTTELFISEVYDALVGENGAIEIYNGTGAPVNLSSYSMSRSADVGGPANLNFYTFPNVILQNGDTYIALKITEDFCSFNYSPPVSPQLQSGFNENDEINLLKNGVIIDKALTPDNRGFTMIRNSNVIAPNPVYNSSQWTISNTEDCSNLTTHALNTTTPETITSQPVTQTICENGQAGFTVVVSNPAGFTYQWKVLNAAGTWVNVVNNTNYSGATTATLTINQAPLSFNENQYYCEIILASCTIPSNAVQLYVNAAPAAPTVTPLQPTCAVSTGTITVTPPATGTGYIYSINGTTYQTSNVFSGLLSNTYSVTIQTANGCISAATQQVINPAPATSAAPVVTPLQPTCAIGTGTITVTPPATGTGYSYSIGNNIYQNSNIFQNLTANTYNVTIKNSEGCISAITQQVINPAPATPAAPVVTPTQPTCAVATGTITVTPVNSATYSINGTTYQTSNVFSGLLPNTYSVTVQTADGCISAATQQVINPAPATPAAPVVTPTQPTCAITTGTIKVTPPATGTGYTYSINGTTYQTSNIFSGLLPNTYSVTIQTADGCISVATQQVINPAPATPAAPTVTPLQPTCAVGTGTITVTPPATGTGYTYSINGITYQTSNIFSGLLPNTYSVTIQSAGGCISAAQQQVINPASATPAAPVVTPTQPTCTVATGTITVTTPITGTGYTYSIGNNIYQNSNIFQNLTANTYNITIKNSEGCISAITQQVINPAPATPAAPTVTPLQPTCAVATGTITVTPVNSATYSINGTTYQTSNVFSGLLPNTYSVTIQTADGCISTATQQVINPAPATPAAPTVTPLQPTCAVASGTITVTPPATGTGYTYSIGNNIYQTSNIFQNLTANTYNVTIKNSEGCISAITQQVINTAPITPAAPMLAVIQPTCAVATGTITISFPTGTVYTYSIDGINYQTGNVFSGLEQGIYNITVQNTQGCISVATQQTINAAPVPGTQPGPIIGDSQLCAGGQLTLSVDVPGGIWTSSNTAIASVNNDGIVTANMAGPVLITYTSVGLCTTPVTKTITVNPLPKPALKSVYLCKDPVTNLIASEAYLSSGLPSGGFTFTWTKNGAPIPFTTSAISVGETGTYTVTATNTATGCSATATAIVSTSSIAIASATVGTDFSRRQVINVNVTGGSGEYEFSLDNANFQSKNTFTNITEGEYTVYVKDRNGCGTAELNVYALNYPRFFSPNEDGKRDTWNINVLSNQPDTRIYIYDRYGKVITTLIPGRAGWDGTYNGERLPATDYWFSLNYRSSNGTDKEFKAHFSLLR